jgi:hypothetical protein
MKGSDSHVLNFKLVSALGCSDYAVLVSVATLEASISSWMHSSTSEHMFTELSVYNTIKSSFSIMCLNDTPLRYLLSVLLHSYHVNQEHVTVDVGSVRNLGVSLSAGSLVPVDAFNKKSLCYAAPFYAMLCHAPVKVPHN